MVSYAHRYAAGEHQQVWNELRRLGPVLPEALRPDVDAVATETMRRVVRHVDRIAEQVTSLGFVPAEPAIPVRAVPTGTDRQDLVRLEADIGGLPAALRAWLAYVGGVHLVGDCPPLGLAYHTEGAPDCLPDPLSLPDVGFLRYEWTERTEHPDRDPDERFWFPIAPCELHKANISGSTHDVDLPQTCADPVIHDVRGRPGITLVDYLRVSVSWGGFPGWEFSRVGPPPAVTALRAEPDF